MIKRDYYKLKQAAEILKCSEDDIIHYGANDILEICVLTAGFDVTSQRVDLFEGEPLGIEEDCFDKKTMPLTASCLSKFEAAADRNYVNIKSVTVYQDTHNLPIEKVKYRLRPKPVIPEIIYSHKNRAHRPPAFVLDRPPLVSHCEMVIMADELERFQNQIIENYSQTKEKITKNQRRNELFAAFNQEHPEYFKNGDKQKKQLINDLVEFSEYSRHFVETGFDDWWQTVPDKHLYPLKTGRRSKKNNETTGIV